MVHGNDEIAPVLHVSAGVPVDPNGARRGMGPHLTKTHGEWILR